MPTQPPQTNSNPEDSDDSWDGAVDRATEVKRPEKRKRELKHESEGEEVGSDSEDEEDTTGEDTDSELEEDAPAAPKKKGPATKKPKQAAANKPDAPSKKPDGPAKKKAKAKADPPRDKAADVPSTAPAATKVRNTPAPVFFETSPLATEGGQQQRQGCTPQTEVSTFEAYMEGQMHQHKTKMDKVLAAATNGKGKVPKALASPHLPPTFLAPLLTGNF